MTEEVISSVGQNETTKEDRRWCVYMHIFPNNKAYIGITCEDPKRRWKNGQGYRQNQPVVYNAIKHYGWENIEHYIFQKNLTEQDAKHLERLLIAIFKTNCKRYHHPEHGYNMTDGGEGCNGKPMSDETKAKLSKAKKGKLVGAKNPNFQTHRYDGEKNPMYGKKHTDESIKKMRNSNIYRKKPVQCIETGIAYDSRADAHRNMGISVGHISRSCKTGGLANGYHFKEITWEEYCEYKKGEDENESFKN